MFDPFLGKILDGGGHPFLDLLQQTGLDLAYLLPGDAVLVADLAQGHGAVRQQALLEDVQFLFIQRSFSTAPFAKTFVKQIKNKRPKKTIKIFFEY